MCDACGCGGTKLKKGWHRHEDGTVHRHHEGSKEHSHRHDGGSAGHLHLKTVALDKDILAGNNETAARNREFFGRHGIRVLNIISSPGAGKTMLLEKTLDALKGKLSCAVITGDIETDNDARRLEGRGAEIRQIQTHGACHLTAEHIAHSLPDLTMKKIDVLFIENVGNLVCPASFGLGEQAKIALLSVTEGEDKPVKYPEIFSRAELAVITKIDLLPHLDCDISLCHKNIRLINPRIRIIRLSAKTGEGLDEWLGYVRAKGVK